jgi:hypothetical protein
MVSLDAQNLMLLRAKSKPLFSKISLGISGKQSHFNPKTETQSKAKASAKLEQNPDMGLLDDMDPTFYHSKDHIKQQIYFNESNKKEMVIVESKGSSQIHNHSTHQGLTHNASAA